MWVPIASGPAFGAAAVMGLGASSDDSRFGHGQVKVSFDNFRVDAGAFSCPDRWNAGAGDWKETS